MRFSSIQLFNQGLQAFDRLQSQNAKVQEQIATGKKVLTPSDDPLASVRIQALQEELSQTAQFKDNIVTIELQLSAQETYIDAAENMLMRARDLTVQAGSGALTHSDRQAIATELRSIREEMLLIANARDGAGKYIFAGYQSNDPPYEQRNDGRIYYVGDEGERSLKISTTNSMSLTTRARSVFTDIRSLGSTFATSADPNNVSEPPATISIGEVVDEAAFETFFNTYPDDYLIEFNDPPTTMNFTRRSNGFIEQANVPFVSGDPITINGMQFEITGTPQPGDRFYVESRATQSIFETFDKLLGSLTALGDTGPESVELSDDIGKALQSMDNTLEQMLTARTSIGTRMNATANANAVHEDIELLNQTILADIRDVDYEEAISKLTYQSFILEAAQQSYARITNLSLFNFLR